MAIVFADGAEAGVATAAWSTPPTVTSTTPRTGLRAYKGPGIYQPPISDDATIVCGQGIRPKIAYQLLEIAGASDSLLLDITPSVIDLTLNGTSLGTLPLNALPLESWSYVEVKWTPGASGAVQLRINGQPPAGWTDHSGNAGTGNVGGQFYNVEINPQFNTVNYVDDLYCDDSDFLGPQTIGPMAPTSDVQSDWTGSDGNQVDNWQMVNDFNMTTYIGTTTPGHIQICETADPALSGVPMAVVATALARDAAGSGGQIKVGVDLGGTQSSTTHALDATARAYSHIAEAKPGGGAWTLGDVNSARVFVEAV